MHVSRSGLTLAPIARISVSSPHHHCHLVLALVLVCNITFEKQVALRFTLDDWQTTLEVLCMTTLVVSPGGGGNNGLEHPGRNRGIGVGRPGEEHIAEAKDEGRCFRKGHDYVLEGEQAGSEGS